MILPLLFLSMAPADEAGWVQVTRNRQVISYVDARSVRAVAGPRRLRLRQRVVLANPLPSGAAIAEYEVEISCEARTLALWGGVELDRHRRVVRSFKYSQPPVAWARQNSVGNDILDFACRPGSRSGLGDVADPLLLLGDEPLWSEVSRNRRGTHYVDAGHVTVRGDRKTVWHRVDFAEARPNGAVTAVYNVEISCARRTIALLGGTERNLAGHVVRSRDIARPGFRAIVPNSVGERVFAYFCEPSDSG